MQGTDLRGAELRATSLLSSTVVDESGRSLGRVRDVRVVRDDAGGFQVAGLVVGGGRVVHAWGFVAGRATGPWLLRALTARAARQARFVPAKRVSDWGPGIVRIHGRGQDLPPPPSEVRR